MWVEVTDYFNVLSWNLADETEEKHEKSSQIDNQKRDLQNMKQDYVLNHDDRIYKSVTGASQHSTYLKTHHSHFLSNPSPKRLPYNTGVFPENVWIAPT
jgi:hypothetical protein